MPSQMPRRLFAVLVASGLIVIASALPAAAFRAPVAYWRMETLGASGHTMRDSSSTRSNDGTATDVKVVNGWDGRGYKFNGETSGVVVPNDTSLNPGSDPMRIVTYPKFRFVPGDHRYVLLTKGGGASSGRYAVLIDATGRAVCSFTGTLGTASVRSATPLAPSKRHQVICGKVDDRIWMRVDGIKRIAKVKIGRISNTRPLLLGTGSNDVNHLRGGLDETTIQIGPSLAW